MATDDLTLFWPRSAVVLENWGDKLNPALVGQISGRRVRHASDVPPGEDPGTVFSVIGSHLRRARPNYVVWGTGFIGSGDVLGGAPRAVTAVRGPLSREKLLAAGVDCPPVYGDPALLYPALHAARRDPRFDLGIIQHVRERGEIPVPAAEPGVATRIIDITGSLRGVADAIVSCRRIVSSSLHGIIAAHAYGVPASWITFSDLPLGDGFKFRDYWASVGRPDVVPHAVHAGTTRGELLALRCPIRQVPDLDALIGACPFLPEARRGRIRAGLAEGFRMADLLD